MIPGRIDVYWHECRRAEVPADDAWLAESELPVFRAFRIPKRRDDWRLGRWTAKRAIAAFLHRPIDPISLAATEIRAADSGAPELFLAHAPAPVSISLTHCNGTAACAVTRAGASLGCDLEAIEPRSDAFIADYFLESEQACITQAPAADRSWLPTLFWSAKESALKALREGLRLDTRSVEVQLEPAFADREWSPVRVTCEDGRCFQGWWRRDAELVRTLVSDQPSAPPMLAL